MTLGKVACIREVSAGDLHVLPVIGDREDMR